MPDSSKLDLLCQLPHTADLQQLCDLAFQIMGNPIFISDMAHTILAYTKCVEIDDPTWQENIVAAHLDAYFSRLFRTKTGQKFSEYLALRRIERAKLLLVSSAMPIAEIARAVGYPEANSFARLFKAYTNMTPAQYRKQGGAK